MGNQGYPKLKGNASEGACWYEHVAKRANISTHRFPLAVLSLFIQNKSFVSFFDLREMRLALHSSRKSSATHSYQCVYIEFSRRVQTMVWLPAFEIFNVLTDVDASDCTLGLYGHRKRVCTGS